MSSESQGALDEGLRRLQDGDLHGAVERLQSVVRDEPANGQAYAYLGVAHSRLGDLAAGIAALQEAARLQPRQAAAQYNLGVALMQAQRTEEARAALEQALALDPTHARARATRDSLASPAPVTTAPPVPPAADEDGLAPVGGPPREDDGLAPVGGYGSSPPVPSTAPLPAASAPPPTLGMQYTPAAAMPRALERAPSAGQRIGRGLGWGALMGQWWTLLNVFWIFFWSIVRGEETGGVGTFLLLVIVFAVAFAFVGSIMGLIIGASNASVETGAIIGAVFGILMLGVEFLIEQRGTILINAFFWFFTGRFIGAGIAGRVQQTVGP